MIYQAIMDGRLLDMTDKVDELDKLTNAARKIEVSIKEEEPLKVFAGKDDNGQLYYLVPKDLEDQKRIEAYIAKTGNLPIERENLEVGSATLEPMPKQEPEPSLILSPDEDPFAPLPDKQPRIILAEN